MEYDMNTGKVIGSVFEIIEFSKAQAKSLSLTTIKSVTKLRRTYPKISLNAGTEAKKIYDIIEAHPNYQYGNNDMVRESGIKNSGGCMSKMFYEKYIDRTKESPFKYFSKRKILHSPITNVNYISHSDVNGVDVK